MIGSQNFTDAELAQIHDERQTELAYRLAWARTYLKSYGLLDNSGRRVSSGTVRDFRGAMVGRADRGLLLTTGTFTRDAQAEAVRDGAPPIDLVDADRLLDKMKELELGVDVEMIEKVSVRREWFQTI